MSDFATFRTAVYRFRAADGWLLYVGMTADPAARFAYHREHACWWAQADESKTAIDWYDTRAEAARAELAAIRSENPEWNLAGKSGVPGVGRPRTVLNADQEAAALDVTGAIQHAEEAEAAIWQRARQAREVGVPDTVLCRITGLTRSTLNRRLGSRSTEGQTTPAETQETAA